MNFIICIAIAWILSYYGNKVIRKHANLLYGISATLATVVIVGTAVGVPAGLPEWLRNSIWSVFAWGSFATALFVLVMFAGAVPKGSVLQKTIIPIRKELSIIASILSFGHNFSAGQIYFIWLFTKPDRLQGTLLWATLCSVALILLMIPLFVTSFTFVRKKMKPKSWKNLQRLSYLFYGLIYLHVLLLYIPKARMGHTSSLINVAAFSVVFLIYAAMRIQKALNGKTKALKSVPFVAALAICAVVGTLCVPTNANPVAEAKETANTPTQSQSSPDKEAVSSADNGNDNEAAQQAETIKSEDTVKENPQDTATDNDTTTDNNTNVEETQTPAETENKDSETLTSSEPKVEESKAQDTKAAVDNASEQKDTPETQTAPAPKEAEKPTAEPKKDETKAAEASPEVPKTEAPKVDAPKQDAPKQDTPAPQPTETPAPQEQPVKEAPAPEPAPAPAPEPAPIVYKYKSGTFSGTANGYNGPITVSVSIKDDVITAISVVSHSDDEPFWSDAKNITGSMLSAQSADVSTVSGATFSSRGIKEAVKAALNSAKN